jgi:hypothetical protein
MLNDLEKFLLFGPEMKIVKIISFCWAMSLTGCGDLDVGARYQEGVITKKRDTILHCYRIYRALDAQMTFISSKDVCAGFNSSQDICFGKGDIQVFYTIQGDTIDIYTNVAPKIPRKFPYIVRVNLLDMSYLREYERRFKAGLVDKVTFDTVFYELPCSIVPDTSRWSM